MQPLIYIINCPPSWLKVPPLSLFYLKNYLKKMGIEAKIMDLNPAIFKLLGGRQEEWLTLNKDFEKRLFLRLRDKQPDFLDSLYKQLEPVSFLGFSLQKRNAPFSFLLAEEIRKRFPAKKLIFGGPETLILKSADRLNPDYFWVVGEGEKPLYRILRNDKKKIYCFEEIDNLDSLPFLDFGRRRLRPYAAYLPLLSSRGCIYKCNFCSERLLYRRLRRHSPGYMFDQIKYLKDKYKINSFIFADSMLNHSNVWLEQFCNLLITNKSGIKWEAQIRIKQDFPAALAKLMKASGCYNLFVGLESGAAKTLKMMNKGFLPAQAVSFFRKLRKQDLHFEVSLIVGYPGETQQDFKQTVKFILANKKVIPKIAQVNPFVDYLGKLPGVYPAPQARERVNILQKILREEKIRHTKSYINNLVYK